MELLGVGADGLGSSELINLNDVNADITSLVGGGHLVVHLSDGTNSGGISVLLVQVVDASLF